MTATGILDVVTPRETKTFAWNGNVDDREAARAAFDEMMSKGGCLAIVHDTPGRAHQVSSFTEIEDIERERGVVSAQISPALVGG